jgi:CO dehydrogenase maturation factor
VKIAVSGKGGVGKTTLASLLCNSFRDAGYRVIAIDADPDANLAATLGFPNPNKIVPISEMKDLIMERTGVDKGSVGMFFTLNPKVDDIPDTYSVTHNGIRLLVMGKVKKAGSGCYCPESAFIKELVGHLLLDEKDVVIMDMEAGIEHLGRGTSRDVDAFIIVVEPGKRSLETAQNVINLAKEIGIDNYNIVISKARSDEDVAFVKSFFDNDRIVGTIPLSDEISMSGREDSGVRIEDMSYVESIRNTLIKGVSNG